MATGDQPVHEEVDERADTLASPDVPLAIRPLEKPSMDIHPPHAVRTLKDFLMALLTVFIGILLALGLESLLTWQHHRTLVREARENISQEIKTNKETMDTYLQDIHKRQKELKTIVAAMQELERTRKLSVKTLDYNYTGHTLYSAAWHAATTSGAVTYMNYGELRGYTEIYDTQQQFQALQDDGIKTLTEIAPAMTILDKDLKTVPTERFEELERQANKALLTMQVLEALAKSTLEAYASVPQH